MAEEDSKTQLLPGTLDLLLLKTLALEPMHGYGIALRIKQISRNVLLIEEGTLYPALQRLLVNGWVKAEWRRTENNRRARYYRLTPEGRKQLERESKNFDRLLNAMVRIMEAT
jgi:transcriptional regulator